MQQPRWLDLMARLGLPPSLDTHAALLRAYAEPHRHYHTATHIDACLALLDAYAHLAPQPAQIELALWFHDAVYDPHSSRNEQDSAEWARTFLQQAGAAADLQDRIPALIMATCQHTPSGDADAALLVDIDLAILGATPQIYARFEQAIRAEYAWVPPAVYSSRRREILAAFLAREPLFATAAFQARFAAQAQSNLRWGLQQLDSETANGDRSRSVPTRINAQGTPMMETPSQMYAFLQNVLAPLARKYSRLQVTGLEHLPPAGSGAIIACNHSGSFWWDALCLIAALGERPAHFVAHHWDAKIDVMRRFLEKVGCGFLDEHLADINESSSVVTGARAGRLMCLYPEESYHSFRHRYTLFKFSPQVAKYAHLAQVPIIPVTIIGAEEAAATFAGLKLKHVPLHIPFHPPLILPFQVTVNIGQPCTYEELLADAQVPGIEASARYEQAAEQLRLRMYHTLRQYKNCRLSEEKYIEREAYY